MTTPRLTIGIPTVDRPHDLQQAIDSCLKQRLPVRIIVADQGHTDDTANVMAGYSQHPHIQHVHTEAKCLWENWEAVARECDTEFFAWLQDDDVISRAYSACVTRAFDAYPDALHWQARCYCSVDRIRAEAGAFNGPQIGLRSIDMLAEQWGGQWLLAPMYINSWALSPGVAFRCGKVFNEMLESQPEKCDLFYERTVIASMGLCGPWIADPIVAGYWHQHKKNESLRQNLMEGECKRQIGVMIKYLDRLLDQAESWRESFLAWLHTRSVLNVLPWIKDFECHESRYAKEIIGLMEQSVEVRLGAHGVRGLVRVLGQEADETVILDEPVALDTRRNGLCNVG